MLLELMLSACHECGHEEDYYMKMEATHYKESMYLLTFKCPVCGATSEVLASEEDIRRLFHK
jgi:transcription initiation factor IIE alpha subunit